MICDDVGVDNLKAWNFLLQLVGCVEHVAGVLLGDVSAHILHVHWDDDV